MAKNGLNILRLLLFVIMFLFVLNKIHLNLFIFDVKHFGTLSEFNLIKVSLGN